MSRDTEDRFREGYASAKRFYGETARWQLDAIVREVEAFRAKWPSAPLQVASFLDLVEQLAAQGSHDRVP